MGTFPTTRPRSLARLDFRLAAAFRGRASGEQNNRPDLACAALAPPLDIAVPDWVQVADQNTGLPWRDVVRD